MATVGYIREPDLPRLAELYTELAEGERPDLDAMRASFAAMEREGGYFLVGVWDGDELCGAAEGVVCRQLSHDSRPFMVMENFIVAAAHRRKGLGRLLIAEIERLAVENRCRTLFFCSGVRRTGAHAFYESAGFAPDVTRGFKKYL
jgi:GNAT superfamily N-acetyltransferase